ncbi:hypothetical protein ACET3Z_003332 [Daucus carota]
MESSGLLAEKFCTILKYAKTIPNELTLPADFCLKYGHRLLSTVDLKLRNGYVLSVEFDRSLGRLNGVSDLFQYLELKGGELLLFEYFGRYNMNIYVMNTNCSEMNYPDIIDPFQEYIPQLVTVGNGGWRFICFLEKTGICCDEIEPPRAFLDRCGRFIPENITYLMSNGKKFEGNYWENHQSQDIAFSCFEIVVEDKHMSPDCYIVDISNKFRMLCKMWDHIQSINVYYGVGRWMLDIRKRDDYYCSTIVDGWQIMRDCLKLNVGDRLVFECPEKSVDHFSLRVVKNLIY